MRKAALFPPYSLICRIMVVSESNDEALEALKSVYFAVEDIRKSDPGDFLFLNKMHSPIKKIQNKVRYQVLARLKSDKHLEQLYDAAVKNSTSSVLVYVEENPVNLS